MIAFSQQALNTYFVSIESDAQEISLFAANMQVGIIQALSTRFLLSPSDIADINNIPTQDKIALVNTAVLAHHLMQLTETESVRMYIEGFEQADGGTPPPENLVKYELKPYAKGYGTLPDFKWEVGVKSSWSIC